MATTRSRCANGRLAWTGLPKANIVDEFRFGWFTDRQADTFDQDLLPPRIGLNTLPLSKARADSARAASTAARAAERAALARSRNDSWTLGKAHLKFGSRYRPYQGLSN